MPHFFQKIQTGVVLLFEVWLESGECPTWVSQGAGWGAEASEAQVSALHSVPTCTSRYVCLLLPRSGRGRGAAISHKSVGNLGGDSGHAFSYSDFSTSTPAIKVVSLAVVSLDWRIHVSVSQERNFHSLKTWIQTRCKLSVCNYI